MAASRAFAAFVLLLGLAARCAAPPPPLVPVDLGIGATRADAPVTVFLTRHGEKAADDPKDPTLSPAGTARAAALAESLEGVRVTHLFASEFKRTQATLAPLAQRRGLTVTVVPAQAAAELVAQLRALPAGSVAVVAGHSNTVPRLVEALGGTIDGLGDGLIDGPAGRMLPDAEYGRLMAVVLPPPEAADRKPRATLRLHYGAAETGGAPRTP